MKRYSLSELKFAYELCYPADFRRLFTSTLWVPIGRTAGSLSMQILESPTGQISFLSSSLIQGETLKILD